MTATPEVELPDMPATIRNPATGAVAGTVRWTDPADVPRIAAGLREAQRRVGGARRRGSGQGAGPLRGVAGRAPRRDRVAADQGDRQVRDGRRPRGAAADHDRVVLHQDDGEGAGAGDPSGVAAVPGDQEGRRVHYRPRPVVAIIAPWNYPVANLLMDGIAALAAGCAVLLKPSERTPLTAELLLRGWIDSGAPEVMAIVQGAREAVEAVVDNSDYIQFTGSSATGAKVMERAARRLTPVSLELGGKDPMIVLEDADVELAAHAAVWGAMFNAGQTCVSVERVYVLEPVYDQFVDAVVRDVQNLKMGAGEGYDFGALRSTTARSPLPSGTSPTPSRRARRRSPAASVRRAPAASTAPTVLVDVDHSMACMTEETFGPTLPIMKVSTRRGGGAAGQRQPVRPERLGVLRGHRARERRCAWNSIAVRSTSTT